MIIQEELKNILTYLIQEIESNQIHSIEDLIQLTANEIIAHRLVNA